MVIELTEQLIESAKGRGTETTPYKVSRDLSRYYNSLRAELKPIFTIHEALYLMDILAGCLYSIEYPDLLWPTVARQQVLRNKNTHERYGVDYMRLMDKLMSLGYIQSLAVVDAFERFFELQQAGSNIAKDLYLVGLIEESAYVSNGS